MNVSALLVLVSAVVSVYGYHGLPCSHCDQPCSADRLRNVTKQLSKHMSFSDCRENNYISNTASPTWRCRPTDLVLNRIPNIIFNATCEKCSDQGFKAVEIVQNINTLLVKPCKGNNYLILDVKPMTISLGCTCAEKKPTLG